MIEVIINHSWKKEDKTKTTYKTAEEAIAYVKTRQEIQTAHNKEEALQNLKHATYANVCIPIITQEKEYITISITDQS